MDKESLYWTLSTLPQVCSALVAFIGFLVLDSLREIENRRSGIDDQLRRALQRMQPRRGGFVGLSSEKIEAMSGDELAKLTEEALALPEVPEGERWPSFYCQARGALDWQVKQSRRVLGQFVKFNLGAIAACLIALPILPAICQISGGATALGSLLIGAATWIVWTAGRVIKAVTGVPSLKLESR